jgi:transcriptional regulator with XRE-family HTH domain
MNTLDDRLNNLHFQLGLNRSGMAKRLGISRDKYLRMRMGTTEPPSKMLEKIAELEVQATNRGAKPSYALADHEPLKMISAEAIDRDSAIISPKDAGALISLLLSEIARLRKELAEKP